MKLPYVNDQTCENLDIYKGAINISIQLCAGGDRNKDSCGGDSGGPLTYKSSTGMYVFNFSKMVPYLKENMRLDDLF